VPTSIPSTQSAVPSIVGPRLKLAVPHPVIATPAPTVSQDTPTTAAKLFDYDSDDDEGDTATQPSLPQSQHIPVTTGLQERREAVVDDYDAFANEMKALGAL